jgi:hypothetical protein
LRESDALGYPLRQFYITENVKKTKGERERERKRERTNEQDGSNMKNGEKYR